MPDIVLERMSGFFADRLRAYEVRVDGEWKGRVKEGQVLRIPVSEGAHRLRLKIDWCSSPELAVTVASMDKRIQCGPNVNPLFSILNLLLKTRSWIWLREV